MQSPDVTNPTKVFYIPEFGLTELSQTAQKIEAWCRRRHIDFEVLEYPICSAPSALFARFGGAIGRSDHLHRIFVGASLGGFWAKVLAATWWGSSVLIDPITDPASSLRRYVTDDGPEDEVDDEDTTRLTPRMLADYAAFRDKLQADDHGCIVALHPTDGVENFRLAQAMFDGHAQVFVHGNRRSRHATFYMQSLGRLLLERDNAGPAARGEAGSAAFTRIVSHRLWAIDPMHSGCHANPGMEDEYDVEAAHIVQRVRDGVGLRQAVVSVFEQQFWPDCFDTPRKRADLDRVLAVLTPLLAASTNH